MNEVEWYKRSYRVDPMNFHPKLDAAADLQATFLIDLLGLKKDSRVLDLAGGAGRIAIPMARKGIRMTVLDLSPELIQLGQERAREENLEINWVTADMREIPAEDYDAVISIFTSFGYFDAESENESVLTAAKTALRPGGALLVDLTNRDMRIVNQQEKKWKDIGDLLLLEDHRFDLQKSRWIVSRMCIPKSNSGTSDVFDYNIRLYSPHEIVTLCNRLGFKNIKQYANLKGDELLRTSWRHVTVATN